MVVASVLDLVVAEVGREPERRESRLPEDLVRVGAPDTRERALVAEERMELAALAERGSARASARRRRARPARGARDPRPAAPGVTIQTPARFFLPASVRTSSPPSAKRSWNIGRVGAFLPGRDVPKAPGAHQVDAEHELAVLGREDEVLPAALGGREAAPLERVGPRIERLQRRDVRRAGPTRRAHASRAGSSSRTQASTSGSSGMAPAYFARPRRRLVPCG